MKIYKNCFLQFYSLFIFVQICSESYLVNIPLLDRVLYGFRFMLLVYFIIYSFIKGRFLKVEFIVLGSAFFAAMVNTVFFHGGNSVLFILLIVIAFVAGDSDYEDVLNITIKATFFSEVFIVLLCFIGLIPDMVYPRSLSNITGTFFAGDYNRHTFGFINHNQIPLCFLELVVLMIVSKKKRMTYKKIFMLFVLNYLIFQLSSSRTVFLMVLLILGVMIYLKFFEITYKNTRKYNRSYGLWVIVTILVLISIAFSVNYNANISWLSRLNAILNGRLDYMSKVVKHYDSFWILFWGNGKMAGTVYDDLGYVVDNGYVKDLIQRGILIEAFVIFVWSKLVYKAEINRNGYLLLGLFSILGANMVNAHLLSFRMIPLYCMLFDRKQNLIFNERYRKNVFSNSC